MNLFNIVYESVAIYVSIIYGLRLLLIDENPILWKLFRKTLSTVGTPEDLIGPEYKFGVPNKKYSLLEGDKSKRPILIFSGRVTDLNNRPLSPPPQINIWHPNEVGHYSFLGYDCRGIITCDSEGYYKFETVVPRYITLASVIGKDWLLKDKLSGRARPSHFHITISHLGKSVLTTQIYFEGGNDVAHSSYGMPIAPTRQSVKIEKHNPDNIRNFPYNTGTFNFSIKPATRTKAK